MLVIRKERGGRGTSWPHSPWRRSQACRTHIILVVKSICSALLCSPPAQRQACRRAGRSGLIWTALLQWQWPSRQARVFPPSPLSPSPIQVGGIINPPLLRLLRLLLPLRKHALSESAKPFPLSLRLSLSLFAFFCRRASSVLQFRNPKLSPGWLPWPPRSLTDQLPASLEWRMALRFN